MSKHRFFSNCLTLALLACLIISFSGLQYSVLPALAQTDYYSHFDHTYQSLFLKVNGATFAQSAEIDSATRRLYFLTNSEGNITVTATCSAQPASAGEISVQIQQHPSLVTLGEDSGTNRELTAVGTLPITDEVNRATVYCSGSDKDIELYFYTKPTILLFSVIPTSAAPGDTLLVTGETLTKDYMNAVLLNYTYEGITYKFTTAQCDGTWPDTGRFKDNFIIPADMPGDWTVVATLYVPQAYLEGTGISQSQLTDTKSIGVTVSEANQFYGQNPQPTGQYQNPSPTDYSQPSAQNSNGFLWLYLIFALAGLGVSVVGIILYFWLGQIRRESTKIDSRGFYRCGTCGQPLVWVQQYGMWYCNTCQKYA